MSLADALRILVIAEAIGFIALCFSVRPRSLSWNAAIRGAIPQILLITALMEMKSDLARIEMGGVKLVLALAAYLLARTVIQWGTISLRGGWRQAGFTTPLSIIVGFSAFVAIPTDETLAPSAFAIAAALTFASGLLWLALCEAGRRTK